MIRAYVRVSTVAQGESGLGMDVQKDSIRAWLRGERAPDDGVTWHVDPARSGSSLDRPELQLMLAQLRPGDRLVVSRLDRLSRSLLDFAGLLQRSQREGWSIICLDLGVDLGTSTGRLVAGVIATVAEFERSIISERTSGALAQAKKRGRLPGKRSSLPLEVQVLLIEFDTEKRLTLKQRAAWLNEHGVATATGVGCWTTGTVDGSTRSARLEAAARLITEQAS
jgi:DNA invertase Pin-like site-specific DNA recombinase